MRWLLIAVLVVACGDDPKSDECPPGQLPVTEACLRAELGVPADAERVLILSQSSHLDWDWLLDFDGYFDTYVDDIFLAAFDLLAEHDGYYYSIAEMGFLQATFAKHPDRVESVRAAGDRLRIVGGGITTPDNLLPRGESFIRDYLVGKTWMNEVLGLPIRQAWIPDDFGHDANLPIVLEAMGMQGVGFARVPGVDRNLTFIGLVEPEPDSIAQQLLDEGIDFVWQAPDGSEVLAHWMPESYCQGDKIDTRIPGVFPDSPPGDATDPDETNARIQEFLDINGPASPTPYVFVPIGCDFQRPKLLLLDYAAAWNETEYERTGVWAAVGTFDHYVQLVDFHRDQLEVRRFDPTPYWTGFYATRPLIKTDHLRANQALLAAEVFGAIADAIAADDADGWRQTVEARTQRIHDGWIALVPSNHHDYITGTAVDDVYFEEQLPRLDDAVTIGETERDRAMTDIAAAIEASPKSGDAPVAVFNQLGFGRNGVVEMPAAGLTGASVVDADGQRGPVQVAADGSLVFHASAPSMGYATVYVSSQPAPPGPTATATAFDGGDRIVLENDALRATITRADAWGISSLVDLDSGAELIANGAVGNELVVYADRGGLYRFGHEFTTCEFDEVARATAPATVVVDAQILESGPVRARVRTEVGIDGQTFTREYVLVAGEPLVRVRATGAAAEGTSVFVQIPLAGSIDELVHGTPYHWSAKAPLRFGAELTFEATHDFAIARGAGDPLGAVYHAGIPAWAVDPNDVLMGALWRNTPESCEDYGADGVDPDEHELRYAVRIPSGIAEPETGANVREARGYHTPLRAVPIPAGGSRLPESFSLVSVEPAAAIATVAKAATADPEQLILRVYHPSNATLAVSVTTNAAVRFPAGAALSVRRVSALEQELPEGTVQGDAASFAVQADRAITSVAIGAPN